MRIDGGSVERGGLPGRPLPADPIPRADGRPRPGVDRPQAPRDPVGARRRQRRAGHQGRVDGGGLARPHRRGERDPGAYRGPAPDPRPRRRAADHLQGHGLPAGRVAGGGRGDGGFLPAAKAAATSACGNSGRHPRGRPSRSRMVGGPPTRITRRSAPAQHRHGRVHRRARRSSRGGARRRDERRSPRGAQPLRRDGHWPSARRRPRPRRRRPRLHRARARGGERGGLHGHHRPCRQAQQHPGLFLRHAAAPRRRRRRIRRDREPRGPLARPEQAHQRPGRQADARGLHHRRALQRRGRQVGPARHPRPDPEAGRALSSQQRPAGLGGHGRGLCGAGRSAVREGAIPGPRPALDPALGAAFPQLGGDGARQGPADQRPHELRGAGTAGASRAPARSGPARRLQRPRRGHAAGRTDPRGHRPGQAIRAAGSDVPRGRVRQPARPDQGGRRRGRPTAAGARAADLARRGADPSRRAVCGHLFRRSRQGGGRGEDARAPGPRRRRLAAGLEPAGLAHQGPRRHPPHGRELLRRLRQERGAGGGSELPGRDGAGGRPRRRLPFRGAGLPRQPQPLSGRRGRVDHPQAPRSRSDLAVLAGDGAVAG